MIIAWLTLVAVTAGDYCYTQSWDACSCDDILCSNGTTTCIDECDQVLASDACSEISAECDHYDVQQCGVACWNGLGSCPQCRDETCDIRPAAFCHGSPSCCKYNYCPAEAMLCGDCWSMRCGSHDAAVAALGSDEGDITEASLTAALTAFDAYLRDPSSGITCNCNSVNGTATCMTAELCLAVEGLNNISAGLPVTPSPVEGVDDFDLSCCSYCLLIDEQGVDFMC